jgi:hypothetical protein
MFVWGPVTAFHFNLHQLFRLQLQKPGDLQPSISDRAIMPPFRYLLLTEHKPFREINRSRALTRHRPLEKRFWQIAQSINCES